MRIRAYKPYMLNYRDFIFDLFLLSASDITLCGHRYIRILICPQKCLGKLLTGGRVYAISLRIYIYLKIYRKFDIYNILLIYYEKQNYNLFHFV